MEVFGFGYSHDKMKDMRELFCGAKTAKIYRINSGTAATAKIGELTVTAKYGGLRGNDLRVVVAENVDEEGMFDVATYMDMEQVDVQTVANIDSLIENKFVKFSGTGALTPTAATPLTGGTTEEVSGSGYTDFLAAAEKEDFNVLAYNGTDEVTKKLFVSFTKRLRDEEGVKFVTVLYDYPHGMCLHQNILHFFGQVVIQICVILFIRIAHTAALAAIFQFIFLFHMIPPKTVFSCFFAYEFSTLLFYILFILHSSGASVNKRAEFSVICKDFFNKRTFVRPVKKQEAAIYISPSCFPRFLLQTRYGTRCFTLFLILEKMNIKGAGN